MYQTLSRSHPLRDKIMMRSKWVCLIVILLTAVNVSYPAAFALMTNAAATNPFACPPFIPCQEPAPSSILCHSGQVCTVIMQDSSFSPQTISAQRGATMVWLNRDSVPHTSTSYTASGWHSGFIALGQSYSPTVGSSFIVDSSYYCHCNVHASMVGVIKIVQ